VINIKEIGIKEGSMVKEFLYKKTKNTKVNLLITEKKDLENKFMKIKMYMKGILMMIKGKEKEL
jgi:hypothetical protein